MLILNQFKNREKNPVEADVKAIIDLDHKMLKVAGEDCCDSKTETSYENTGTESEIKVNDSERKKN